MSEKRRDCRAFLVVLEKGFFARMAWILDLARVQIFRNLHLFCTFCPSKYVKKHQITSSSIIKKSSKIKGLRHV